MAALTDSAQAARADASLLCDHAGGLMRLARSNVDCSRTQLGRARVEARRARAKLLEPLPSPWSELCWMQPYETLEQTLVPLR